MASNQHVSSETLRADIGDGVIDTVIVAFADHQGRLIGKRTDGAFYLDVVIHEGTENCDYLIACDLDDTPIPGFRWASYEQGYGDMRGAVDESTIRYLPWLESTALVLVDLVDVDHGTPVAVSPRRILQEQVERAVAAGFLPKIGSEVEFFLFKESFDVANAAGYASLTANSPYLEDYAILQTTKEEDVLGAIRRGLRDAGLPLEFSKGEAGKGQHEVNLTYQTAIEMADINLLFKNAVKEIAHRHDRSATFMAKPHFDDSGSSCHIHSSLWNDDSSRSLMPDDDGEHHMSDVFRWYLGGLIATARDFSLLFAPNVNSYKRFQPGSWAPTGIGWDVDNRTLGFRVVGHGDGMRVESRIPGADANSYHAFAATIAAGLHGIEHRIEPPPPYTGNGYTAPDLPRIPSSLQEAIELWRASAVARERFGDDVHHHVLNHAEAELAAFNGTVTDWERRRYFERI
ncbi:MAG: glutamine synthetase [Acidimicrobiia bacterium]|nr:glutamine synthetase [Acidimicrobiia bacterium]